MKNYEQELDKLILDLRKWDGKDADYIEDICGRYEKLPKQLQYEANSRTDWFFNAIIDFVEAYKRFGKKHFDFMIKTKKIEQTIPSYSVGDKLILLFNKPDAMVYKYSNQFHPEWFSESDYKECMKTLLEGDGGVLFINHIDRDGSIVGQTQYKIGSFECFDYMYDYTDRTGAIIANLVK